MKVTNHTGPKLQNVNSKKTGAAGLEKDLKRAGGDNSPLEGANIGSSTKVDLSPRAKEINRVKEMAKKGPDIDEARVAHFQNLIDKGLYKVDSEKVADRLVNEHAMNALAQGDEE